jgi:hypothetical protein
LLARGATTLAFPNHAAFRTLGDGAGMANVVNLKRFKKRNEREQSARQAEANRARFGRTKSQRARDELDNDRASRLLDQHQTDGGDAS